VRRYVQLSHPGAGVATWDAAFNLLIGTDRMRPVHVAAGGHFACQKCGKELHADYNAARNIAHKYLQNRRKSGSGGVTHHLALKSGTLNGNGNYSPSTVSG
jgi:hypothetical protein